eukprot:gb/GFBE01020333.1/.p1 GENE.gb/GFBE01020333.1/~~gb/GFBE01020333.1/.p1  ORF type:complete len:570 (+),score=160.36 gb/GFBE01020333.1/:1-1710(+)
MGCSSGKEAGSAPASGSAAKPSAATPVAPAAGSAANLAGLSSDDPEVLRKALHAALSKGMKSPEVAQAEARLREKLKLPADWDMLAFSGGNRLEGGLGGRKASTVVCFQKQPPQVEKAVQSLFDGTFRKVYTRDRRGAPIPDRFVIKEVHRVLNDQVWREYSDKRDEIKDARASQKPKLPDGSQTVNHLNEKKINVLPPLDEDANEHWLFHGTTAEAAKGIAENDFRLDLSGTNAGTLYGKGIYLAENATKSDEYGEGPKGPAGTGEEAEMGYEAPRPPPGPPPPLVRESYILICRSALGNVNYNDEQRPDPDRLQKSCTTGEFDSVVGDRLKLNRTFREIVVYNDDHVYPEYVVKYERIFFHERFAAVYEAMLKRSIAGKFTGPTSQEKEVLESLWNVYAMPNKGKISKSQLLDLLLAIYQPPDNEDEDLDKTFQEWDRKGQGKIDWEDFFAEVTQRVNDKISCSGPERFAEIYKHMMQRKKAGSFDGPDVGERAVMRMVWYQYCQNQRTVDKFQLLDLLKAIHQPPANEGADLDETFKEIDTKQDGVIDLDEFMQEITQRVNDEIPW